MIDKANEISHRELNARLPVHYTGDDLERLSITLNQMISRLEESLQNSRRFTSDASHELRTPLTIIRGELEQLLTRKDMPDSIGDRVTSLLEETDRLIGIAEGLLTLSRLDAGEALRHGPAERRRRRHAPRRRGHPAADHQARQVQHPLDCVPEPGQPASNAGGSFSIVTASGTFSFLA